MTDEEWKLRYKKWCAEPDDPHAELTCPSTHEGTVPDYVHDLNAMHEAVFVLSVGSASQPGQYETYCQWLDRITGDDGYSATARQRAEAFLRVIGKWREA